MRKVVVAAILAAVLVVAVPIYFRVGWDRMTSECGLGDRPFEQRHLEDAPFDSGGTRSISYSWHWSGGFTCSYSNGRTRSSYWF